MPHLTEPRARTARNVAPVDEPFAAAPLVDAPEPHALASITTPSIPATNEWD
jgi:hypothetical protein